MSSTSAKIERAKTAASVGRITFRGTAWALAEKGVRLRAAICLFRATCRQARVCRAARRWKSRRAWRCWRWPAKAGRAGTRVLRPARRARVCRRALRDHGSDCCRALEGRARAAAGLQIAGSQARADQVERVRVSRSSTPACATSSHRANTTSAARNASTRRKFWASKHCAMTTWKTCCAIAGQAQRGLEERRVRHITHRESARGSIRFGA